MGLSAGRLRERVTLQEPNLVNNGKGGRARKPGEDAWRDVADGQDLPAEIIPLRGDEALALGVQRSIQLYRVVMRRIDGLKPANRLMWNGVPLNIRTAPPPTGRSTERATIIMTCESGVAS